MNAQRKFNLGISGSELFVGVLNWRWLYLKMGKNLNVEYFKKQLLPKFIFFFGMIFKMEFI